MIVCFVFSICLDCLNCLYCFDSSDWFCDAEQSCLFTLFLGFVRTVCIVSTVYIDSWICSDCFNCPYRFDFGFVLGRHCTVLIVCIASWIGLDSL